MTAEQIDAVEKNFRELRGNKKISVPDNAFMIHGRNPLLVLYVIRPTKEDFAPKILFALGVGFPAASADKTAVMTADFVINAVGDFDSFEYLDDDFDEEGDDD